MKNSHNFLSSLFIIIAIVLIISVAVDIYRLSTSNDYTVQDSEDNDLRQLKATTGFILIIFMIIKTVIAFACYHFSKLFLFHHKVEKKKKHRMKKHK